MTDSTVPVAATPDDSDPSQPGHNRLPRALWATVAAVVAVGIPVTTAVTSGEEPFDRLLRGFPGYDVAIVTTLLQAGADTAGLITFGALLWLLFLRDATPRAAQTLRESVELRVLRWASAVWALCAGGLIVFKALDVNGIPLIRLGEPGALSYFYQVSYNYSPAWTVTFVAASIVCCAAWFAVQWTGLLIPLWSSFFALLAPVVVGQVLVGPEHDFGGDSAVLQTLAANACFGVGVVAAIRIGSGRLLPLVALQRLFVIAAVCLPVIVVTDLVIAWFKLAGTGLLDSATGWQILSRWAALAVLIALVSIGALRWRQGGLNERGIAPLMAIASIMIAVWIGIGAAMTRIPPPQYFVPTTVQQNLLGFDVPDAPTITVLLTQWRPNLLFLSLAGIAVTIYLLAVRTLRRRGDAWPVGRTLAWILGWSLVVIATSSGFGKYSGPDFGVHMIVHMSLNMLAPGLLVLGGVITLLLRATRTNPRGTAGVHDWITWVLHWRVLRFVYNPLVVFVVFIGSYYGLYLTGIFGEFMRFHWAHQFMNMHFLIVGYLYYSLVIGVDRPPRPLPHIGKLGYVLAAMPFHAFFGIILMTGAESMIIAENFYLYLDASWADLPAQQYLGGGVAWAGGELPLMVVIVILAIQWGRQDAKEAKRKDRHIDTSRDDEFDAYNRMLARLAERPTTGPRGRTPDQREEPQA